MRRIATLRKTLGLAAGWALIGFALPAAAEWRRAESDRFIVYSDGSESSLRDYVQKLETFDRVLRAYMGLPMDETAPRKLPIYSVRNHAGLEIVKPGIPDQIAGYYISGDEDIFAIAMRERGSDDILLHEYAHHFMYQNFAYGYPGWFSEGFAEYYATADIVGDRVNVGQASENRGYWLLNGRWIPLADLLAKRPGEIGGREETYYPQAWLLTHWFFSDPQRKRQLDTYLRDIGQGRDSIEAMESATGMDLETLTRTLRAYTRQRLLYRRITHPFPEVPVTVTVMPRSADALLLLNQRLKQHVAEQEREDLIAQVRQAAAPWPDDSFAQLVLARAELVAGDKAQAETILTALLVTEPAHVEALQLMARAVMIRADEETDYDAAEALQRRARAYLVQAFAADDANFTTFLMISESRRTALTYPTENDLDAMRLAVTLAPQLPGARFNLAAALIHKGGDDEEAVKLLALVANDPHNTGIAAAAQAMIDRVKEQSGSQADLGADDDGGPIQDTALEQSPGA